VLSGHTEEPVNDVNAPSLADERGIEVAETKQPNARDFTDLVRVTVISGGQRSRVVGTTLGRRHRGHLLEAWGSRFNVQLEDHIAVFRYRDQPGMIGRVGTALGAAAVNIVSAAVGRHDETDEGEGDAVMILTTDGPVPDKLVRELVAEDGFHDGHAVNL
jgi:D-3-phosphoglycerate dehydrogenase